MARSLTGQTAVITGASSGIGQAIAMSFANHGVDVVVADIRPDPREGGTPTHEYVETETDAQATFVECDVTDVADLDAAIEAAEAYGGVSIMVNNAGMTRMESFLEVTEDEYDTMMAINAKGVFFGAQAAAKRMVEHDGGGAIINMSSDAGLQGTPNSTVYAMSKGAITSLTYSLAIQLGPHGIRTNAIHPGPVKTALQTKDLAEMDELNVDSIPAGRVATPDDIANAALFLADPASEFVNGESLIVDGGSFRAP